MWRFISVMVAMLCVQPVIAKEPFDQKCSDDRGNNRCSPSVQANTLAKYGLSELETLAAEGTYVRRAMLVDGYGVDVLAVSFVREKGKDPFVEIRAPLAKGTQVAPAISMPISLSEWNEVLNKGMFFNRDFAPEPGKSAKDAALESICLHSWVATVESANPSRPSFNWPNGKDHPAEIRRKTQTTCNYGLAVQYAYQLVDMAFDMIPVCQSINLSDHRNKTMALNTCLGLSGDRASAAQAHSLSRRLVRALDARSKDDAQVKDAVNQLMVQTAPNDRPNVGSREITKRQRDELVALLRQGDFSYSFFSCKGIDADHVEMEATQIQRDKKSDDAVVLRRRVKILALRDSGEFRIYAVEAPEFTAVVRPETKTK